MNFQVKFLTLLFCIIIEETSAQNHLWSDGTARTVPRNRFEIGLLLSPSRYGLSDSLELTSYLLYDILVPGIGLKKFWFMDGQLSLASTHTVYSPSPFLRFIAREKTGGLLPPDNYIPPIIVFESHVVVTYELSEHVRLSGYAGGKIAFTLGDKSGEHPVYERMQTIDYAFIFPRTAYLTRTPIVTPDLSIILSGQCIGPLDYEADGTYFVIPVRDNLREEERTYYAGEFSAVIIWNISNYFSCRGGMVASVGNNPFGTNRVLYPLLDIRIGFGI